MGTWFRPLPRVRAELDVVRTLWSDYRETADPRGFTAATPQSLLADWDDTTSVGEGDGKNRGGPCNAQSRYSDSTSRRHAIDRSSTTPSGPTVSRPQPSSERRQISSSCRS